MLWDHLYDPRWEEEEVCHIETQIMISLDDDLYYAKNDKYELVIITTWLSSLHE